MEGKSPYQIFEEHQGLAESKLLAREGISPYRLKKLVDSGKVEKIHHGLYQWAEADVPEVQVVQTMVSAGVFCLDSAAFFHDLTVSIPPSHRLAIPRKAKIVLPEYPLITLMYWDETRYKTGISQTMAEGVPVMLYDKEKTLCDLIHYQKKLGIDIVKEVTRNYLSSPDRNLDLLGRYAKTLHQSEQVNYLITLLS